MKFGDLIAVTNDYDMMTVIEPYCEFAKHVYF